MSPTRPSTRRRFLARATAAVASGAGLLGLATGARGEARRPTSPGGAMDVLSGSPADPRRGGGLDVLVAFEHSAFPYDGEIPDQRKPFLDAVKDGRRGHTAPRFGVYPEDPTYADRRVLLTIPPRIDWAAPVTLVVFFHGNQARLARDVVERQGVPRQLAASGANAVLVAPQLAVDALDSSAGHFWERGFFARFVSEAVTRLAALVGDPRAGARLAEARIVIVAYSGGYLPTAFSLERGGLRDRIAGVVLLDGLYAEEERVGAWISDRRGAFFFSAHSPSTRGPNGELQRRLTERGIAFSDGLPERLDGGVHFLATANSVVHDGFMTRAWTADPLAAVLARIAPRRR